MKLGRHDMVARDDGSKPLAVFAAGNHVGAVDDTIRMEKIGKLAAGQAVHERVRRFDPQIVPTHVGDARRPRKAAHVPG